MIRKVVKFQRWHLDWLEGKGPSPDGMSTTLGADERRYMESQNTWTLVVDGTPVAIIGSIQQWPGRYFAWAYLNELSHRHMIWITKVARKKLDELHGRIEMSVNSAFAPGHAWAKLLKFEVETPLMKGYGPQGEPHTGYVRLNP